MIELSKIIHSSEKKQIKWAKFDKEHEKSHISVLWWRVFNRWYLAAALKPTETINNNPIIAMLQKNKKKGHIQH